MKVAIQSQKWIKPATPTPLHLQKLNLSSIDQLVPSMFVRLIVHFDSSTEITDEPPKTPHRMIDRLQESLSQVLTLYYPFAGGYHEGEAAVDCQDQGVEFVVATVDQKLQELAGKEYDKEALVGGVGASDVGWTPVVSVQVNVFTCGRLAIGLSFLHKVIDMFTFSTFMNAWATACRHETLNQVVKPSFNLSSFLPATETLKPPPLTATKLQKPPLFVSKRYIFTNQSISKLKSSVNSSNYTRLELVMALITRNLLNIECSKPAKFRPLVISQPMNLRPRMKLPIEENSCGNLCIKIMASQELESASMEVRQLAELIHNSVRKVSSEIEKLKDWKKVSDRVVKAVMDYYGETRKGDEEVNLVRFSSWCRFPLYEVDFGWGRPTLVSTVPSSFVITHLMDHKGDDGGIEAWVCLKEDDMACFKHKPDILEFASY